MADLATNGNVKHITIIDDNFVTFLIVTLTSMKTKEQLNIQWIYIWIEHRRIQVINVLQYLV